MSGHFQSESPLEEMLDLYLLDALDGGERAEVTAHLARACPECQRELPLARMRMAALALAAPEAEPSPALKRRILAAVGREPERRLRSHRRAPAPPWTWAWGGVAAALIVLCLVLYGRLSGFERRDSLQQAELVQAHGQTQAALQQNRELLLVAELIAAPNTRAVDVAATPAAPRARAFLNPARGAVMIVANLPPAASHMTYQMWLLPASGHPVPAGVFQTNAAGAAVHADLRPFTGVAGLAVSLEPEAGSPQPTGPIVLAAQFPH